MSKPRSEILELWVSSISGGGFPAQIQSMIFYLDAKKKSCEALGLSSTNEWTPDINMASSGGNVATYIALSGNYTQGGINRVIQNMDARMFSRSWAPKGMSFLPTWIFAIFEGSVFKPGYGSEQLLKAFSDKNSIQQTETWTGTYNKTQKRTTLFCNKKLSDSYISGVTYSTFTFKTTPLYYMDGDFDTISKAVTASASVPFLFEPVKIGDDEYEDGGVSFPSPLTPLQEEIYKIIKHITVPLDYETILNPYPFDPVSEVPNFNSMRNQKDLLHITYFSPYDMNSSKVKSTLAAGALTAVSDYSAIKDRYTAINLIERVKLSTQDIKIYDSRIVTEKLEQLLETKHDNHYFLEIYVRDNTWIDMATFTPADIFQKMEEAKSQIEWLFYVAE